jgi:hypothetical protein
MDVRRSINTKIWSDNWVETLNPTEKLLWVYLLTNNFTNMLGIYEITSRRIQFDTGITEITIRKALEAFERVKKCFFYNGFIILPNWIKNQSLNPNMLTSAERLFNDLPNELIIKLKELGIESFESLRKGLEGLPNPSEKGNGKGNGKGKESEKVKFAPPTLDEFKKYFKENNYPEDLAERAWKGYEVANWIDSEGKKILNWKQKAQHVWFKNNNKDENNHRGFRDSKIIPAADHDKDRLHPGSDI